MVQETEKRFLTPFPVQHRRYRIFTPNEWLIGQAEGKSNVSGITPGERFWHSSGRYHQRPFVAVLGLHCSGSSTVAMLLHHLGVHVGNELGGYEEHGGGEAAGLASVCEDAAPFPETRFLLPSQGFV